MFTRGTSVYERLVGLTIRGTAVALLIYVGLLGLTYFGFQHVPTGFVPTQDKGYLLVNAQLPDSASLERTQDVMRRMEKIALAAPGVQHTLGMAGQSFLTNANASNQASMFVILKPFHERQGAELRPRRLPTGCGKRCSSGSKMHRLPCSARRRSTDWATPAASS